jgi:hypothetical protein
LTATAASSKKVRLLSVPEHVAAAPVPAEGEALAPASDGAAVSVGAAVGSGVAAVDAVGCSTAVDALGSSLAAGCVSEVPALTAGARLASAEREGADGMQATNNRANEW